MKPKQQGVGMSWWRLTGMIAVSTAVMFLLMYQFVYSWDHAIFSISRLLASVIMACVMSIIMLAFMSHMYKATGLKTALLSGAAVPGTAPLDANRAQALIGDVGFLRAMFPHPSNAVNKVSKATIRDPACTKSPWLMIWT